ncbi:MAG: alpha-L-rhamnosidase-related protein [Flavisolibacter sp.]
MRNIILPILLCLFVLSDISAQKFAPTGLMCELLSHSELSVITDSVPDFGWIVNSNKRGDYQVAYAIMVASSPGLLKKGRPDMWNTGKIETGNSININYAGKPLLPNASYWWKVRTWNKKSGKSKWSTIQKFNISGVNANKQWPGEAKWVQITNEKKEKIWAIENRHPISYHDVDPERVVVCKNGNLFYDFKKSAFSTLTLNVTCDPKQLQPLSLKIAVGEKAIGDSIDQKPGGGIIYQTYSLELREGTHDYELNIPRFISKYPHSQDLPSDFPEVVPFRYCEITLPTKDIKINKVTQKALYYLVNWNASSFSSSNDTLNAVYDLCRYSTIANTYNGDYANSQRERMMYEADCYIQQMCHYSIDREYAIARYSTENLIYHATWPTEWISHSIFMAWADYLNTGNTKLIANYYEELKPKTLIALENPNGLISTLTGLETKSFLKSIHFKGQKIKDIVDWPSELQGIQPSGERDNHDFKTYNTVVNAFYYRSLVLMGKMARAVNKDADADFFEKKAESVKRIFNEEFLDRARGIYIDGIGSTHSSIQSNIFSLAFGLVPEEHEKSVVEYIKSKGMACGVYAANYLLEGLYNAGADQYALDLMTSETDRSWMNMIKTGSTMTTEAWDIKYMPKLLGWSHAWSASPAHIIPRKLMGIEPAEPGYGKIIIKPQPGNLKWATLKLPTIRGEILASIKQEIGSSFELNISIPQNTTAKVSIPKIAEKYLVTVDGKVVAEPKIESSRIIIDEVASGAHSFKIQKAKMNIETIAKKMNH